MGKKIGIAKAGTLVQRGMKSGISRGQYLGTAGSEKNLRIAENTFKAAEDPAQGRLRAPVGSASYGIFSS